MNRLLYWKRTGFPQTYIWSLWAGWFWSPSCVWKHQYWNRSVAGRHRYGYYPGSTLYCPCAAQWVRACVCATCWAYSQQNTSCRLSSRQSAVEGSRSIHPYVSTNRDRTVKGRLKISPMSMGTFHTVTKQRLDPYGPSLCHILVSRIRRIEFLHCNHSNWLQYNVAC